jgi:chromate transporter
VSTDTAHPANKEQERQNAVAEVFLAFLKLGLTSFGGPIAHLGYFRDELVVRRKWIDEAGYGDLVAQFLPGPASSQVGFSLGVLRGGGLVGGLAAWFAFTMPSALILLAFALGAAAFTGPVAAGFLHGLKLVAVAVVAQAISGMTRTLTRVKRHVDLRDKATRRFTNPVRYCDGSTGHSLVRLKGAIPPSRPGSKVVGAARRCGP